MAAEQNPITHTLMPEPVHLTPDDMGRIPEREWGRIADHDSKDSGSPASFLSHACVHSNRALPMHWHHPIHSIDIHTSPAVRKLGLGIN